MSFLNWIINKISPDTYNEVITQYIELHQPKSVAEIEGLTREFERKHLTSWNY